jgi:hypothetical protein
MGQMGRMGEMGGMGEWRTENAERRMKDGEGKKGRMDHPLARARILPTRLPGGASLYRSQRTRKL